jgi:alpha-ketoglutarate-dependent taurine dioxygenase
MTLSVTPLHDAVGVELAGLDLGNGAAPAAVATLVDCVHRHGCALMRGQELAPAALARLGRALGEPLPPYRPQYSLPAFPEIIRVGNLVEDGHVVTYLNRGGVEWHADSPGSTRPPGLSLLYCLESHLPDGGGETGFASTVSGYRALPAALKARIEKLALVHSFNTFNDQVARYRDSTVPAQAGDLRERNRDTLDPMVQTHPATGARHLYVSHAMVKAIPGKDFAAGMQLVLEAVACATAPDLVYKHVWRPGDLMVFDNRGCLHTPFPYAYDDYPRTRRLLLQIITGGKAAGRFTEK